MAAGAYKLTKWVIGSVREFEKNENWTCADYIKLDGITYQIVEDDNTRIMMYEKGELDWTTLTIDAAKQYEDDPRLLHWQSNYSHVIDFCTTNTDKPFLASENFRLAIFYGLDRVTMAKVSGGSPATGIISPNAVAYADGTSYRNLAASNGVDPANYGYDPVKAVAYFEKALQECGLTSIEVTLLAHSNSSSHTIPAEYMQESLSNLFGKDRFKMNLDMQPSATALAQKKSFKENPKAYEMTISSWSLSAQDYDPVLSLQVYTTSRASRNGPYGFAELEEIWAKLSLPENQLDEKNRAAIAMEFEKAMIEHAYAVPMPKYDKDQPDYIASNSGTYNVLCFPKPITSTELSAKVAEFMGYYGQKYVIPEYYDVALKYRQNDVEKNIEMIDLIREKLIVSPNESYGSISPEGDYEVMYYTQLTNYTTGLSGDGTRAFYKNPASVWAEKAPTISRTIKDYVMQYYLQN